MEWVLSSDAVLVLKRDVLSRAWAGESPANPPCNDRDLPAYAPLDMPVQSLDAAPMETVSPLAGARRALILMATTLVMTGFAVTALYDVLKQDTLGPLDVFILMVFAPLFAWTAFSFASAMAGLLAGPDDMSAHWAGPLPSLASRTAILSPVYNETPGRLFARLNAMAQSIEAAAGEHFDIFVLSDTSGDELRESEQDHFRRLRRRLSGRMGVYYRHRAKNIDRKAGNIADWVRRFGGAYDFMVVLDADSLMAGESLVRLAGAMEQHPKLGLIQTTPVVVNRHSLFARAEQFASRLYGPLLARGIAWWSGDHGNYWGHNAIIRVAAFAAHAGLPHLTGARPFGGHILSHDFVEAALLRRGGWKVRMAPGLGGSYEESPPTLADAITRDRRWCQGNLQHLKVLRGRGLSLVSRLHLARGVASYLMAPLWFALLMMSALLALKPAWGVSDTEIADQRMVGGVQASGAIAAVFVMSMAFLIAPKIIAFFAMLASPEERARFGGGRCAFAGLVLEILLSALLAPVLMLHQIWALISILSGRDSGWSAQHREEDALSLEDAANQHLGDTAVGVMLGVAAWSVSIHTLAWMLPVIAGMALCIPIAAWTSRRELGDLAARWGLLRAPEEIAPSALIRRFNALQQEPGAVGRPQIVETAPARAASLGALVGVAPAEA